MKISEFIIKAIGVVLALVGFGLVLSAVGIATPVALNPDWLGILIGLLLLGAGIIVVRGGAITL